MYIIFYPVRKIFMKIIIKKCMLILPIILPLYIPINASPSGSVDVGSKAPNIILRDANQNLVFVKKYLKKKPVLVSFFYVGCEPCKREMAELERLKKSYGDEIEFILISTDKEGSSVVKPYIKKHGITLRVLTDEYNDIAAKFKVTSYPTLIVIGRDKKIKFRSSGKPEENIKKVEELIKKGIK